MGRRSRSVQPSAVRSVVVVRAAKNSSTCAEAPRGSGTRNRAGGMGPRGQELVGRSPRPVHSGRPREASAHCGHRPRTVNQNRSESAASDRSRPSKSSTRDDASSRTTPIACRVTGVTRAACHLTSPRNSRAGRAHRHLSASGAGVSQRAHIGNSGRFRRFENRLTDGSRCPAVTRRGGYQLLAATSRSCRPTARHGRYRSLWPPLLSIPAWSCRRSRSQLRGRRPGVADEGGQGPACPADWARFAGRHGVKGRLCTRSRSSCASRGKDPRRRPTSG